MSRSIIVLPDDTAKPILEAIAQAQKSIRVKMFLFSDPSLLDAVIAAQRRGVDVRIMLNPERRDGEKDEPVMIARPEYLARPGLQLARCSNRARLRH